MCAAAKAAGALCVLQSLPPASDDSRLARHATVILVTGGNRTVDAYHDVVSVDLRAEAAVEQAATGAHLEGRFHMNSGAGRLV